MLKMQSIEEGAATRLGRPWLLLGFVSESVQRSLRQDLPVQFEECPNSWLEVDRGSWDLLSTQEDFWGDRSAAERPWQTW